MAKLKGHNTRRHFLQGCFKPDAQVQPCRPSTAKGETIIRLLPEVDEEGNFRPMINCQTPDGPDFSNFTVQPLVNVGSDVRFVGIARSSDRMEEDERDMVFTRIYMRVRSMQKAKTIPDHLKERVEDLTSGGIKAALKNVTIVGICQAVVTKFNDKSVDPTVQAVFLTTTAMEAISDVLAEADKEGIDAFDPKHGREIILTPEKQRGSGIELFNAELGEVVPLKASWCKKTWQPWDKILRLHTHDELVRQAVAVYGREIVELAMPDQVARLFGDGGATPVPERKAAAAAPSVAYDDDDDDEGLEPVSGAAIDEDNLEGDDDDAPKASKKSRSSKEVAEEDAADPEALAAKYKALLDDDDDD